jgi:hypothetical protein
MREALTAEVADKHDQNLALRRKIQLLEERCREADMQTHFRDDVIKEMRKDLKVARLKASILTVYFESSVCCFNSVLNLGIEVWDFILFFFSACLH